MFGAKAAKRQATEARKDENARQDRIRQGTKSIDTTFGQFNDGFYQKLADSFTGYARPQLDDQYNKAKDQLTFALARNGTLDSSIRSNKSADLTDQFNTQLLDLTDKARGYATDAKTNVERARSDLVTTLNATGDATAASNAALARAKVLATPPSYSPLGQLFTDFTSALGTQAALERAFAFGSGVQPRYTTGLFGAPAGAVKVTN